MTASASLRSDNQVLWVKVLGLALMQGAIALMWVIYNLYLVDLLTQVGLPRSLATGLLVIENLLAMVMEPLMGSLSDRLQQQLGTRFPLISLGVILTAGLFMALPVIALGGLSSVVATVLPIMLVLWALTMTLFRSPALSLLGRYAYATRLPQAASLLTLIGGVAGAMGPLASDQILQWGPVTAFVLGSVVLVAATIVLRLTMPPPTSPVASVAESIAPATPLSLLALALIFGAGAGVTWGFRSLMLLFSRVVSDQIPNANVGLVLGTIFMALAVTAIPAGTLAVRLGNQRAMILGLALLTIVGIVIGTVGNGWGAIALAIVFGAAFSLVSNGTIPFALSQVPTAKAGLGTGLYFSGGAAASSLFSSGAASLKALPLFLTSSAAVLALLLAASCIAIAPRRFQSD